LFRLSAFADEISPVLEEQIDVLKLDGIDHIELRGVSGKNVLDFTDDEVRQFKGILDSRDVKISAIGSPIGKIKITDDFESHLVRFDRSIQLARAFETPMIRIFSFFMPEGEDPAKYRDEVLSRMKTLAEIAKKEGVILVHENEREIYGDTAARCLDVLESVGMDCLVACHDPANYNTIGEEAYPYAYNLLLPYIKHVHIKDAKMSNGEMLTTLPGEGDGRIPETLADLKARGYDGFLTMEPHLAHAGTMFGFTGPDLFRQAVASLKSILP